MDGKRMGGGIVTQDIKKPIAEFCSCEEFAAIGAAQGDERPVFTDVVFGLQTDVFVMKERFGHGTGPRKSCT